MPSHVPNELYYRKVGLVNETVSVDQVATQRTVSDAPSGLLPLAYTVFMFCTTCSFFFYHPSMFVLCVTFCGISKLCGLPLIHILKEQYVSCEYA